MQSVGHFSFIEIFPVPMDCDWESFKYYVCANDGPVVHNDIASDIRYTSCPPGQFQCEDGRCIVDIYICDGILIAVKVKTKTFNAILGITYSSHVVQISKYPCRLYLMVKNSAHWER